MINIDHGRVYKVTANPENFITAISCGYWGLNESLEGMWEKLEENDVLLFHATSNSSFKLKISPGIVGWARVGSYKSIKEEPNWIQEFPLDIQESVGVEKPPREDARYYTD
jgi:hypothetical protein